MPCISGIELLRRGDVQEKVAQGCLQGIERKIKNIECEDGDANSDV